MNPKKLIAQMAALAAAAVLCGYASAPALAQETAPESAPTALGQDAAGAVGTARKVWAECVRAAVSRLDDSVSPSAVVAQKAMNGCADQYTQMERAVAGSLAPACSQSPDCTRGALAKIQREATKAATDEVIAARVRVSGDAVLKCQ